MTTTKHSLQAAGTGRCQEVRGTSTKKPMTGGAGVFASRGRLGWLFRSRLDWFVDASFVQNKTWFVLTFPSLWRQRCFWSGEERNSTTCPLAHLPPSPFCATPDRPSRLRHSGPLIKPTTIPFHCLSSPTNNIILPSTTHISTLKPPTANHITSINMSAPNANAPNEGIVGQIGMFSSPADTAVNPS